MEQSFEQSIPISFIIAGFIAIMFLSRILQKKLKARALIREGQITKGARVPTIEERLVGNPAWSSGEIRSFRGGLMIGLWLLAIVWSLTIGTAFIKSFTNPAIPIPARIFLGILSCVGLVAIGFAVRATMQHFRYGTSSCFITGKAGVLGKQMKGIIRTANDVEATGNYNLELQCVETYSVGSGKNRKTEIKVHWQEKQAIPHLGKSTRAGIAFSFDIASYPPETGYQLSRGNINWQLSIKAPVKGVDYSAMFIVPVFKMG